MSEQPSYGPLGLFLGDLSAIREKRNVSLEALRDATKVYPNVILQFEEDGLKDHPLFNALYVRAFIRSYAQALGISAEEVLHAYDEALEGSYKRQLAIEHLDLPPEEIEALQKAEPPAEPQEPVFTVDKFEFKNPQRRSRIDDKIEEAAASGAAVTFIPKSKEQEHESAFAAFVDKAKKTVSTFLETGKQNPIVQWGLVAGGIGLGLFVILQLLSFQSTDSNTADGSSANTAQQATVNTPPEVTESVANLPAEQLAVKSPRVPVMLGDSIPMYIVAVTGKLDPFRLQKDRDLRRPYWLNEGDSMMIYVKDRAIIEDHLEAMKISIDGKAYPIYRTDSLAKVVITRDSIQTFLEFN